MIIPQPMTLVQQPEPFDDWDWLYEIKHDGFRALAVIEYGQCRTNDSLVGASRSHRYFPLWEIHGAFVFQPYMSDL
jgi:hypothetical protein